MTTIVPQNELARRALDWICEHGGAKLAGAPLRARIEEAAVRFNLGPLEVEFLERFFANGKADGAAS